MALLAGAPAAHAQTILNFDNFTAAATAGGGLTDVCAPYSTQGDTLTSNTNFYALAGSDPKLGDGETSLYSNGYGSTTIT